MTKDVLLTHAKSLMSLVIGEYDAKDVKGPRTLHPRKSGAQGLQLFTKATDHAPSRSRNIFILACICNLVNRF